ncbi:hypothetical protein [Bradyrhizobium sp. JYMT SZCCT0180]|uniref:hypothetical protein n=1 Tax=Bradyrhizobium sp. JYMT SZCCT0180 TaxID=2807666 RepID=UPI001BA49D59|nr:hypothetical protein [Bradyrhizobium sp. JYMT SZCCT0180]MBR1215539.1 hypothetical protein [Bradyrhizobium sp. JYMT SZCCT0180]
MFKTVSGISAIAFAVLLLLQVIPVLGFFILIFGGPYLAGLLLHVFLVALAVESWLRRIPRALIAIPLVAYGSYFGLYVYQTIDIARVSAELRKANSGKVLDFNAEVHSLVTPNAQAFVSSHKVSAAYESNANFEPEGYLSYRLIRTDQCKIEKDSQNRIQTWGARFGDKAITTACLLRFPEKPPHQVASVTKIGDEEVWKHKAGISAQISELTLDGKVIGVYKTASVWRLPAFPVLMIGCFPMASRCAADFNRSHVTLDTVPDGLDRERFDGPESVMLGIPKYSSAEIAEFRGYPQNEPTLAWLADEPARVQERMFSLLKELAEGGYPKVPGAIGFSVARDPSRLAPLAEAMANRFIELSNIRPSNADGQQYNYRYEGLAKALTAVPDDAFAKVAAPLHAYFVDGMSASFQQFPELIGRIQRASGPQTPDFYEMDFVAARGYRRLFPTLAICRIGRASPAVISEMRARILRGSADITFDVDSKSALIVTLLKLGQESFVREYKSYFAANAPANFESWVEAVLSGKGATEIGPNNCMSMDWNGRRVAKPSLAWANGVWYVRPL